MGGGLHTLWVVVEGNRMDPCFSGRPTIIFHCWFFIQLTTNLLRALLRNFLVFLYARIFSSNTITSALFAQFASLAFIVPHT